MTVNLYNCLIHELIIYQNANAYEKNKISCLLGIKNCNDIYVCTPECTSPGSRILIGNNDLKVYGWNFITDGDERTLIQLAHTDLYWTMPSDNQLPFITLNTLYGPDDIWMQQFKKTSVGDFFTLTLYNCTDRFVAKERYYADKNSYLVTKNHPISQGKFTYLNCSHQ